MRAKISLEFPEIVLKATVASTVSISFSKIFLLPAVSLEQSTLSYSEMRTAGLFDLMARAPSKVEFAPKE